MDAHVVRYLGFMLAENARVHGMVAENAACAARGEPPTYTADDFFAAANNLDSTARGL